MLFIVRFDDHQHKFDTRTEFLEAHIEWLDSNSKAILVGGSLRETPQQKPLGGLWVVEAESKSDVETLVETDPFWINGLRSKIEILHWSKAFEDRFVEI